MSQRFRRSLAIATICVLSAACTAAPTATPPATPLAPPSSETSPPESSSPGTVVARLSLTGLLGLAPAISGVWYVRSEGTEAWIGQATTTGSGKESAVGPAPVAVAATADALYLLEGQPTFSSPSERTNAIERLDPTTLRVLASSPVSGLGTDLVLAGGEAWVVTAEGDLHAYRFGDLAPAGDLHVGGNGAAHIAATDAFLWVLNGLVTGTETTLLTRISLEDKSMFSARIEGHAGLALSVGASGVWVATGSDTAGQGMLYPLAGETFGTPVTIPAPAALVDSADGVWWASVGGLVGVVDGQSGRPRSELTVGTGATDITTSGGLVWVAEDALVAIRPHS